MGLKLALGTAQFGLDYGIANIRGKIPLYEVYEIIDEADMCGIRYYDTAEAYGNSFDRLIRILKDLCIKDAKIISKIGFPYNMSKIEYELGKIGGIYGMLSHDGDREWKSTSAALRNLKDSGVIKKYGSSVYSYDEAMKVKDADIIQLPFNVFSEPLDLDCFKDKEVFIRSIFLQGILVMHKPPKFAKEYVDVLKDFVIRHGINRFEFILAYVRYWCPNAYMLIGVDNLNQLKQNVELYNKVEDEDWTDIIMDWEKKRPEVPEHVIDPRKWKELKDAQDTINS